MVEKDRPKLGFSINSVKLGLRVGVHNPKALINYIRYGLDKSVQVQIYDLVCDIGWDTWAISNYWHMIKSNTLFRDKIESKLGGINYGQMVSPEMIYVLVRKLCPQIVVETGVSAGVSSAYILQALEDNQYGKLYSIDYPNYAITEANEIPIDKQSGFVIPDNLKHRWELQIGKSQELLSPLLERLGGVDIFLHDSEHSYQNMVHEYKIAWQYIKKGGLLLSHDINDNNAFEEFAIWQGKVRHEIYFTGMGVIRK